MLSSARGWLSVQTRVRHLLVDHARPCPDSRCRVRPTTVEVCVIIEPGWRGASAITHNVRQPCAALHARVEVAVGRFLAGVAGCN